MDILNRVKELQTEKNWSVYKLASEANLPQSTIANMFTRGTLPSITTLNQICEAFGISLSEFFTEKQENYNEKEFLLISNYRKLSSHDKSTIESLISTLLKNKDL